LDELDFVKAQLARLPTRAEVRWMALRLTLGALAAIGAVALLGAETSEQRAPEQYPTVGSSTTLTERAKETTLW
jgi:hypothetical protein